MAQEGFRLEGWSIYVVFMQASLKAACRVFLEGFCKELGKTVRLCVNWQLPVVF